MKKLQKVISGGQTGVDQAALRAALELDFLIGGWCSPGRDCENGKIPTEYPLIETKSERSLKAPDIPRSQRTEFNVRDSGATLILIPHEVQNDPGTLWTTQCACHYKKPYFVMDPSDPEAEKLIIEWLKNKPVDILNIAGPSESKAPGINNQAYHLILRVLKSINYEASDYDFSANES